MAEKKTASAATSHASRLAVIAAFCGNLSIAVAKFTAAFFTGSSAMMSEGVHSTVDTINEALLLYGIHRSSKPPDDDHPLGHGREIYFWSFVVALLIFSLGAGLSFYEGASHIRSPEPISNPAVTFIVLGISLAFEGASWFFAFRSFRKAKYEQTGYVEAVIKSKDPATFIVLLEDSAAILGIAVAAAGIAAAQLTGVEAFDGVASIGIGVLLTLTAVLLARETKSLLIGEQASRPLRDAILAAVRQHGWVRRASELMTIQLAPNQIIVALNIQPDPELTAENVGRCLTSLEQNLKDEHPEVIALMLRP